MANIERLKQNYWIQFGLLLVVVFLLVGKPVPFSNEYVYLLRLMEPYHADFLLNDFIFSEPAKEHWLFDHLFGLLTYIVSIEFIAWAGRIFTWTALLAALFRLGKLWKIPLWMVSAAIFLWLCKGQSVVGDEWIIGQFEAKPLAYMCLIFALEGFAREKQIYPAILLGLSFSFHPAVGLWGIPAALAALIAVRRDFVGAIRIFLISALVSLIGLIPLIPTQLVNNANTTENWRFFELVVFPHHMDPFSWARSSVIFMLLITLFCVMVYRRNKEDLQLKFLTFFLCALGAFFCLGIVLRALEMFDLLRFMPMRLYAVFAPLFLILTLAKAYRQKVFAPPETFVMVVGLICVLAWSNPIASAYSNVKTTVAAWKSQPDDTARAFIWIRENTPNGTIVLAPPWRRDFWYLSRRAQVVSVVHTPISDLNGWQTRLREFVGESRAETYELRQMKMVGFYNRLTMQQVASAAEKYGAGYFITESDYAFPLEFQSGNINVYRLPPAE